MLAASLNPFCGALLQTALRRPKLLCHRQVRSLSLRLTAVHRIINHLHAIAEIRQCNIHGIALGTGKYQARRVILAADAQRMHLNPRLVAGNGRIYLQHVGTQDSLMPLPQVQSIVLHENSAVIVGKHLQQPGQGGDFPVTLCAKAIAIPHQKLGSQSRQLLQPMQ